MDVFKVRQDAIKAYKELVQIIKPICEAVKAPSFTNLINIFGRPETEKLLPHHGTKLLKRFFESGKTVDEVVSWVITLATGLVGPGPQAVE